MNRSISELQTRAMLPLSQVSKELREKCVTIAQEKLPSSAFKLASQEARLFGLGQMNALNIAKATRWLAVICRDYGQEEFKRVTAGIETATENCGGK
ncbi:MAG: hypothetical protein KAI71_06375 [Candidatus Pacebacteria bacterium]|nr:hypothetical protein [Candidatus Paceibacterota bacterium]